MNDPGAVWLDFDRRHVGHLTTHQLLNEVKKRIVLKGRPRLVNLRAYHKKNRGRFLLGPDHLVEVAITDHVRDIDAEFADESASDSDSSAPEDDDALPRGCPIHPWGGPTAGDDRDTTFLTDDARRTSKEPPSPEGTRATAYPKH